MKTLLKIVGAVVLFLVVAAAAVFGWATVAANGKFAQTFESHRAVIAMPWPLTAEEITAARVEQPGATDADLQTLATTRAVARGKHLVTARYACIGCHGPDFGGGEMIKDPAIGTLLGPNITAGRGGRTAAFTMADWDRIVRHGIKADGHPAVMPSEDFLLMSDHELSDIVAYVRSNPVVDAEVARPSFGPIGRVLIATGKFPLTASRITDHQKAHDTLPPAEGPTVEFGRHLAGVCTGCHRADLRGGPITFGPPGWPAAANLTSDTTGLKDWTFEDFERTITTGVRKNGQVVREPMIRVVPVGLNMTPLERRALWTYLTSLPAGPIHP